MTGPDTPFGGLLRETRTRAGLSLTDLAHRTHYSKGYLSKIETGKMPPSTDLARRCDAVLNAAGALAAAARPAAGPSRTAAGTTGDAGGARTGDARLTRRDALIAGAVSLLGVGAGLRAVRSASAVAGSDLVFLQALADLRRQGWTRPPALLLPTLAAQTQAAVTMAALAPARRRADLFVAAARLAEFTGWMGQEADDLPAMGRWTGLATDCAAEAGDTSFTSFVFIRHANVALYRGDGPTTVALAREAAGPGAPDRVLGLAALREAQGHALLGAAGDVRRCLDRGQELLTTAPSAAPTLGISSPVDQIALVRGWCLYDLGRPDEAADVLGPQLATMPGSARRTRARFGCRLALALAADGRLDDACAMTGTVLSDYGFIDSATVRADLRRLSRLLARWPAVPAVRAVSGQLAAALRS